MRKFTRAEFLKRIRNREQFEAISTDGGFELKITSYRPFICAAIHDGHNLRQDLKKQCALSEEERWYEEDPNTLDFIRSMPIVISGRDSRYEYDLNRSPENAIYSEAWGKTVWKKNLSPTQVKNSLKKHAFFYDVLDALVQALEDDYGSCVIFDIHSYNWQRIEKDTPLFNLGTSNIDRKKYDHVVDLWLNELSRIELTNTDNVTLENDVFLGNGYLLRHCTEKFDNTLVLATEVKKIYCDETTGELFPGVIQGIREGLKQAIVHTALGFSRRHTRLNIRKKEKLLSSELDPIVKKVDRELYRAVRGLEILSFINPVNIEQEKRKFFKNGYSQNPEFRYRHLNLDPFELKRELHRIEIEKIKDISLQQLYADVIQAYSDKADILASIDSEQFLFNSLRYFGKPSEKDKANAEFLLFCDQFEETEFDQISVKEAELAFRKLMDEYGFDCKIAYSNRIASSALVLNSQKKVILKKGAQFTPKSLHALAHHEIGVHMVTTMNSNIQPLKIFNLGMPLNTLTQEGLAVISEYLSGNMTHDRLRTLGLRVVAIEEMVRGADFKHTFLKLHEDYKASRETAYYVTARVYRGGGFTKDYLYLRGLREILNFRAEGKSLEPLLIGKTSYQYIDVINEMLARGILEKPKYITRVLQNPVRTNKILDYIIGNIK